MKREFQLSRRQRCLLYTVSLVLFVSGVAWAWIRRLDDSNLTNKVLVELNPWLIEIHGFAALGFVLLFGTLLPSHVSRAWNARRNRVNGAFFLTAVSLLTLSGYTLYYIGDEAWRGVTSQFHLWLGITGPALLFWHIRAGGRSSEAPPAR